MYLYTYIGSTSARSAWTSSRLTGPSLRFSFAAMSNSALVRG